LTGEDREFTGEDSGGSAASIDAENGGTLEENKALT